MLCLVLKIREPAGQCEVAGHQHQIRPCPGGHLCDIDAHLPYGEGQQEGDGGSHDELCDAGDHGQECVAHALNGGTCHMEDVENGQAETHDGKIGIGSLHGGLRFLRGAGYEAAEDGPAEY